MASHPLIDNFQLQRALPLDTRYLQGTVADRDAIPAGVVNKGLLVYVSDNDTLYVYEGDTETNDPAMWISVGGTGIIDLSAFTTDDLSEGTTNLYYTDERVEVNLTVAANTAKRTNEQNDLVYAALTHRHNVADINDFGDGVAATDAVMANTDKVGITTPQAANIITNNDKRTYPEVDEVKLSGIETGAEVNVGEEFTEADHDKLDGIAVSSNRVEFLSGTNPAAALTQSVLVRDPDGSTTTYRFPTVGTGGGTVAGADLRIENEDSLITAAATSINFIGEQINATSTGNEVDVVLSPPSLINIGNQVQDKSLVELTLAEYNALPSRPSDQIYFITDDAQITPNFTGVATDITSVNITRGGDIDSGSIIGTRLDIELSDHTVNIDTNTQLSEAEVQGFIDAPYINGLEIDADTVNGLTVETAVPLNALFTDTDTDTNTQLTETEVQAFIDSDYINGLEIDADTVNGLTVETAVPTDALFTDTDTNTQLTNATILDVLNGATGSIDADLLGNAGEDNVQANWTETVTTDDSYIENKPFTIQNLVDTAVDGEYVSEVDVTDGVISVTRDTLVGEANVQSDWTETDNTSDSFIQNKPSTIQNIADIAVIGEYISEIDIINGVVTIGREALPTGGGATLTEEQVQDIVGDMVSGNVENNIDVTYDDVNGKLDFNVTGGGTTPPTTGLTSLTLSTLSFNSFGSNETVTVSGTPGTMFSFSIADTNPIGWITAGALSVSGTQTIPAGGVYTATLTIPPTTMTVNRSARLVAANIANISNTVNSGLFSQIHTAPATAGNLVIAAQIVVVDTTATPSVNVSAGDFPVTVELFNVDPAVGTPTAIETATLTAVGTHTFTAIDTDTLTPGDQTYYVRVLEQAPGTDVVVEIETFTVEAPVSTIPPGNVFGNFYSTTTPPNFLLVELELPLSVTTNVRYVITYSNGEIESRDTILTLRPAYGVIHTGQIFPLGVATAAVGTVMLEIFNRDTTPFTSIGTASMEIIDSPNAIPDFDSFEFTDDLFDVGTSLRAGIWFNTSNRPSSSPLVTGFEPRDALLSGGVDFVTGDVDTIPEGGSTVRQMATFFNTSDNNGTIEVNRPFPAGTLASYRCWVSTVNPPTNAAGTIKYGPVRTVQL